MHRLIGWFESFSVILVLQKSLRGDWLESPDDPIPFADSEYLIGFELRESFNLLSSWPLHFHDIHSLNFPQSKVKAQIAL